MATYHNAITYASNKHHKLMENAFLYNKLNTCLGNYLDLGPPVSP